MGLFALIHGLLQQWRGRVSNMDYVARAEVVPVHVWRWFQIDDGGLDDDPRSFVLESDCLTERIVLTNEFYRELLDR
jgi:hypothetical protein